MQWRTSPTCAVTRLSQRTTVYGAHLTLAWLSALLSIWSYKNFKMASKRNISSKMSQNLIYLLTRFFAFETNYATSKLPVHVKCLFASDWVSSNDGMLVFHGFPANDTAPSSRAGEIRLFNTRVDGFECSKERHELRRQFLESSNL